MKMLGQGQTFELAVLAAIENTADVMRGVQGYDLSRIRRLEEDTISADVTLHTVYVCLKDKTVTHTVELRARV